MRFAALDLHKNEIEFVVLDAAGCAVSRGRFPATRDALESFARQRLEPTDAVVVEATANTWAVVAILEPHVAQVVVSNPLRTRAIAAAKIKTDRIDALVLAQLLRAGFLPPVWRPDPETRRLRSLTAERARLSHDRTRIQNRIHSLLHQRLIEPPAGELFSRRGLAWLRAVDLDAAGRAELDRQLRRLALVDEEAAVLDAALAQQAWRRDRAKLLMTLPGVDFTVALSLLAAFGDPARFDSGERAAAYLGLVPSTRQSGRHCYHGPITKQGRSQARWMLVQAAQHVARHPGPLGVFFRRLAKRKSRNVAVVAVARKLAVIAWKMLRRNEPYRYARPSTLDAKFRRLRIRATGERHRGGIAKGSRRPAAYGTGRPTRAVPSLDQTLAANGLPAPFALSAGERRTLADSGADGYARQIRQARRAERKRSPPS